MRTRSAPLTFGQSSSSTHAALARVCNAIAARRKANGESDAATQQAVKVWSEGFEKIPQPAKRA